MDHRERVTTMEMESEKEKKKKLHEVEIPDDFVILILNHLPFKTLYRLKAVSKSWSRLVIENLRTHPLFLGLFYQIHVGSHGFRFIDKDDIHNSAIDPTLSFLPLAPFRLRLDDLIVRDCCNGLLLLGSKYDKVCCFVCNPLTKSWTQFFDPNIFSLLDYDPRVSPHFKIVSFSHIRDKQLIISVLSSETPTMCWRWCKPVHFRDPSDRLMIHGHHHALWEGSLYSLFSKDSPGFGDHGKIMRFSGLFEGDWATVHCQLIDLPVGTKKPTSISIGRSRDKLYLAGLDCNNLLQARLRVWSLSTRDQTVCAVEHDTIISFEVLDLYPPPQIGGFHPSLDVLFILSNGAVYAYDLKKSSFDEVSWIGRYALLASRASIFPFFTCSGDNWVGWRTYHKQTEVKLQTPGLAKQIENEDGVAAAVDAFHRDLSPALPELPIPLVYSYDPPRPFQWLLQAIKRLCYLPFTLKQRSFALRRI